MDKTEQVKTLEFKTYDKHCAKNFKTGEYCRFIRFTMFGTTPMCGLYGNLLCDDNDRYIERCTECLNEFGV